MVWFIFFRWTNNSPLTFDLWAPKYPGIKPSLSKEDQKDCVAGPCSTSFGLCKVSCKQRLSYICMIEKSQYIPNLALGVTSPLETSISRPPIEVATETEESTGALQHAMPHMSPLGQMMMQIAENVLPNMVMKMVSEFMHSTNGLIYSGKI